MQDVRVLPFAEGVRPGVEDPVELEAFFQAMQREEFDLAVQLHGGGRFSNPFLLRLGARHTVGTRTPDAARLERSVPYLDYQQNRRAPSKWQGLPALPRSSWRRASGPSSGTLPGLKGCSRG